MPYLKVDTDDLVTLLSMLCLMPEVQSERCDDWDYVMNLIPSSFKKEVFNSIQGLTTLLINRKYLAQPEWLFALPIMHFLSGVSKPFEAIEFDPEAVKWGDKHINLNKVRSHTYESDYG